MAIGGRQYGRYVLEDRIAMGGMAEIFRARTATSGFEKRVCIKRILPHFLEDNEFVTMFRDEARTAAKLQHANVVQVFDFGEEDGTLFLAMELVDGADLRRVLEQSRKKRIPIEVGEALQIASDVCRGLHHAHTLEENGRPLGVVHRDVSPHNILVSRAGEVKVTDFGIARAAERATHTSTGIVKGKVAYMSPEQAQGFEFDHRLDQFATGVVLWEMLCGARLFSGENDAVILKKVLACEVPAPSSLRPDVPGAVDEIVLRALAKDPKDRFPDMRRMELALSRVLFSGAVDAATAEVRNIFARIMSAPEQQAVRKTMVADVSAVVPTESEVAPELLSGPPPSSSDVSLVFTTSDKALPAPGPARGVTADANARAVTSEDEAAVPSGSVKPILNPASSGRNVSAPGPGSGKSRPAPAASPPPALTTTGLPSLDELSQLDDAAEAAPDATPATRTNVPPGARAAPPEPAPSLPAPRAPSTPAEPKPRRTAAIVGLTAAAVVAVGSVALLVALRRSPPPMAAAEPEAPPAQPEPEAPPPPPPAPPKPAAAPPAEEPAPPTPAKAEAPSEPAKEEPAPAEPAKASRQAPKAVVHAPAARKIRVALFPATRKMGYVLVDKRWREVTKDAPALVELPPGPQALRVKLLDGTQHSVGVDVEPNKPIRVSFE